jgi:hypothetical protein
VISSVVRPPTTRSVSATRASADSTESSISRSSAPESSSVGQAFVCPSWGRSHRGCEPNLSRRRKWSIARRLPIAMSQAPGLRGTPDSGHCSSAATQRVVGLLPRVHRAGGSENRHAPALSGQRLESSWRRRRALFGNSTASARYRAGVVQSYPGSASPRVVTTAVEGRKRPGDGPAHAFPDPRMA